VGPGPAEGERGRRVRGPVSGVAGDGEWGEGWLVRGPATRADPGPRTLVSGVVASWAIQSSASVSPGWAGRGREGRALASGRSGGRGSRGGGRGSRGQRQRQERQQRGQQRRWQWRWCLQLRGRRLPAGRACRPKAAACGTAAAPARAHQTAGWGSPRRSCGATGAARRWSQKGSSAAGGGGRFGGAAVGEQRGFRAVITRPAICRRRVVEGVRVTHCLVSVLGPRPRGLTAERRPGQAETLQRLAAPEPSRRGEAGGAGKAHERLDGLPRRQDFDHARGLIGEGGGGDGCGARGSSPAAAAAWRRRWCVRQHCC
jgi:hypothetical protein